MNAQDEATLSLLADQYGLQSMLLALLEWSDNLPDAPPNVCQHFTECAASVARWYEEDGA